MIPVSVKDLAIRNNVLFRVIDRATGKVVQEVQGHNDATNSMLTGIAHYLQGDGVLNQAGYTLSTYVPRYISLGNLGLNDQSEDSSHLPEGLPDIEHIDDYVNQCPGYGSDGYGNNSYRNNRNVGGLGPRCNPDPLHYVAGELVSTTFKRSLISYREIVPEDRAELAKTIDVVYSAMISTGALKQFRSGDNDYVFITEAGLWSSDVVEDQSSKNNHLLAGYRLLPVDMDAYSASTPEEKRRMIQKCILRVGKNQIVQVIWKIQLGAKEQFEQTGGNNG